MNIIDKILLRAALPILKRLNSKTGKINSKTQPSEEIRRNMEIAEKIINAWLQYIDDIISQKI